MATAQKRLRGTAQGRGVAWARGRGHSATRLLYYSPEVGRGLSEGAWPGRQTASKRPRGKGAGPKRRRRGHTSKLLLLYNPEVGVARRMGVTTAHTRFYDTARKWAWSQGTGRGHSANTPARDGKGRGRGHCTNPAPLWARLAEAPPPARTHPLCRSRRAPRVTQRRGIGADLGWGAWGGGGNTLNSEPWERSGGAGRYGEIGGGRGRPRVFMGVGTPALFTSGPIQGIRGVPRVFMGRGGDLEVP